MNITCLFSSHQSTRGYWLFPLFMLFYMPAAMANAVIGISAPLSGQYAVLGKEIEAGVTVAISKLSPPALLGSDSLQIIAQDDGCDPQQAIVAAQALIAQKIQLVIGPYCSAAAQAAGPLYAAAGVIMMLPAASAPPLTEEGLWNLFRLTQRDDRQAQYAAALAVRLYPHKKFAIISDGTKHYSGLARRFKEGLNKEGITERLFASFPAGKNDYPDLVQQLLSAQIDVIYIAAPAAEAGSLLRALRDLSSHAQIIGSDALLTEQFWAVAGTAAQGTLASFAADPLTLPSARPAMSAIKASGVSPEGASLKAYAAVEVFYAAIQASQTLDMRKLAAWLAQGHNVSTVLGNVHFDSQGDLVDAPIDLYRWSEGKFYRITPLTP